ncbi:MAG: amidohydrolase family protein [Desulfuromonadales bacterium]|nr:amidohydrolase family protein [Desulfuromonadales bacterium]
MALSTAPNVSYIASASWMLSPEAPPRAGGAILVREGRIAAVGTLDELRREHFVPVIDHPGCAILPGFINAHTHLELTHFPSWRLRNHVEYHPRRFVDWIIQLIKVKRGLQPEEIQASAREGIRMCLESGTTAVGEIVTARSLAAMYQSSPLAGRMYLELVGHDPVRFRASLLEAVDLAHVSASDAFKAGLSPHATYTIGEDNLPLIRDAALSAQLPLAIHCSESSEETDFIFDTSGQLAETFYPFVGWERYLTPPRRCSSTELLDRAGLLTASTLLIHCVQITRADAEILTQRRVRVALCPRSNERLDVGRAPVALLRKMGIPLALGTDSLASNDSLSLWDEIRFTLDTFADDLSPADLFQMVTLGGATALGIDRDQGSLEVGKRADFQVVGRIGDGEQGLLERVLRLGGVEDVYVAGVRYGESQA